MEKYENIIENINREMTKRETPLDDLYIMGLCHSVQNIALNDNTITREQYTEIYDLTQQAIHIILTI